MRRLFGGGNKEPESTPVTAASTGGAEDSQAPPSSDKSDINVIPEVKGELSVSTLWLFLNRRVD